MIEKLQNLEPVWRMGILVLALLALASAVVFGLRRAQPQRDFAELAARVRSWWMMAGVFFAAVAVSNRLSLVFFGFLSFWALKEYLTLLPTRPADHRALVW